MFVIRLECEVSGTGTVLWSLDTLVDHVMHDND